MQQLIIKKNLDKNKIDALLIFLKSWDIDAELKIEVKVKEKKSSKFTLSAGLWKDYDLNAKELRNKAWSR